MNDHVICDSDEVGCDQRTLPQDSKSFELVSEVDRGARVNITFVLDFLPIAYNYGPFLKNFIIIIVAHHELHCTPYVT